MLSLVRLLAALSLATVVPYFLAMLYSESVDLTVWERPLPEPEDEALPLLVVVLFDLDFVTGVAFDLERLPEDDDEPSSLWWEPRAEPVSARTPPSAAQAVT